MLVKKKNHQKKHQTEKKKKSNSSLGKDSTQRYFIFDLVYIYIPICIYKYIYMQIFILLH